MKIVETKINGIKNPIGFAYPRIKLSWKVIEAMSTTQKYVKILVAKDLEFKDIIYTKEGESLSSIGECLEFKLKSRTRYYYKVEVTGDLGECAVSETAYFETGKMTEKWTASFLETEPEDNYHPVFFKNFTLKKQIKSARIYVSGLGLYEAYMNGVKIGEEIMTPFCNDYNHAIQYQTFDITELLREENKVEIMTGNGWYKGRLGYEGIVRHYGNRFKVIAEIILNYADGTNEKIVTDKTWKYRGSDIVFSDIYDGEHLNRELWKEKNNIEKDVIVIKGNSEKKLLRERYSIPVITKENITVKEVIKTPAGEVVLDFGQNFTGYVEFHAKLPAGTRVVLDHGEILQEGNFYNDNYRTAKAQFIYTSDGREEVVCPHFTFYGFRYVRVSGWSDELRKDDFTGKVIYSDLDITSRIHTSNEKLNRLAENCMWGQKSNFLDMPTDCPQRDERLAWTGDAQVFSTTACYQMDTRAFYRKFLYDLRVDQVQHDGAIANYLPNIGHLPSGSSAWGDAATFIPMTMYEFYGDKDELADVYPLMKDWVDWIMRQDKQKGDKSLWDFGFHFGDWLALDGVTHQSMKGGTEDYFVASIFYFASVLKIAKAAGILEKESERDFYYKKAEKIYQAILNEYFSPNGRLTIDTQTAYLLCLKFNVFISKKKLIDALKIRLKKDCYKIKGGFIGSTMMCQVLAENGFEDIAYYLLFQEGFPGWMHCINLGATTIWERWNSVLDDGRISGTGMNSLNHYAYGSVMEYVYRYIAGLKPMEPGFKSVRIEPQLNTRLRNMNYSYDSVSGKYVVKWDINADGTISVHIEVPFNCSAICVLPGVNEQEILLDAGVFEKTYMPSVDYRRVYNMDTRLEEIVLDQEAMEILKEDLPAAYELANTDDVENLSLSFHELQSMFFMGFSPEMVQNGVKRIQQITR